MSAVAPRFTLALLSRALSTDTLAAVGVGTRDSVYTEDGPGPGTPVPAEDGSTWRPQIAQAQSVGLTVATIRGGYPGREGAQVLYRLESDATANSYRSWQDPVLITGWSAPADGWGSSAPWDQITATVIAETGALVIVAVDQATGDAQTWGWDSRTDTWTTLYDWDSGAADGLVLPVGLAYDAARGKLLLWSGTYDGTARQAVAYESTDGGTTWTVYARSPMDPLVSGDIGVGAGTFATTGSFYPVLGDDLDWLLMANEDLTDLAYTSSPSAFNGIQCASSDGGVTWDALDVSVAVGPGQPVQGPAGFAYVYVDVADSLKLKCSISASARSAFSSEVVIDSGRDYSACWACADADGTLYVVARGATGGASLGKLYAFRSTDGGLTWGTYGWLVYDSGSATHYFDPRVMVAAQGRVHLVGTTIGSGSPGTVQVLSLGGWSQVSHGPGGANWARDPLHRFGWGGADSLATLGYAIAYLPLSAPGNVGWTAVTNTGAASLAATTPGLHLVTTAGQGLTYAAVSGHNAPYASGEFEYQMDSSGNVTLATLGTSGGGVFYSAALLKTGGGGYSYAPVIDVGSDGLQLRDGSTIRATASFNTTTAPFLCRVAVTKGTATAWYSRDYGTTWTRWANGVTVTDGGAAVSGADTCFWGVDTGHVGKVTVRRIGFAASGDWQYGIDGINAVGDLPGSGPLGHAFGKAVGPPASGGYPLPEGTAAGEDLALLSATGGPTHVGELVALPVAYVHGVSNIDPIVSPSPRRTWKALDDSAIAFVWDQGVNQERWHGHALALMVTGTPRSWVLQVDNGSTGWTTVGTLDLAIGTGLTFTRSGVSIAPDPATATISRRIAPGELAGGTWTFDDGTCRKIGWNSGGFFGSGTAAQQVVIELEDIDGTEPASGSAGILCAPSGVLVGYLSSALRRRWVRVTAAASQPCPGGVYEAGCVAVGRLVALSDPQWTWSSTTGLVRRFTTMADGVTTATELGPAGRTLAYTWGTAPLAWSQTLAAGADVFQGSGGIPIGTNGTAALDLPGLVAEMESGALPCVVIPRAPAATASATNPRLFLLGRVSSGSLAISASSGTEGVNEFLTGPSLQIAELR